MTDHEKMILISKVKGGLSERSRFYRSFATTKSCLFPFMIAFTIYTIITRQENRIMNGHELFWKLTGDWGQEKTFWLVPHSARCDWLMRPRPSINQIQTLKCDPYNFSEHALSSSWKRRGTSIVRFSFQVILFNSVKLLLFAIQSVRK